MKKYWKDWKNTILLGVGILILALFLRLYDLNLFPIFGDEAIYVRWAQVMRAESTLRYLPLSDGKQPLFMWLVIPFLKVFSDPLYAGRFLSVLTGLGTAVGVFALSYLFFKNKKVSLLAAFFYAISPFSVFFDRMALVDSMLSFFGIWTLFGGIITAKTLRLDFSMLTGFALGGGLLTKSPAIFFALLLPLTWALSAWPKDKREMLIHLTKLLFLFSATFLIAYGLYNILRLGPNFHMIALRNQDYVFPLSHIWQNPKDPFIFHVKEIAEWLFLLGPGALFLLIAGGALTNIKKFRKEILFLLAWAGIPLFVGAMYAKVFTARYILFSLPYLYILASTTVKSGSHLVRKALVVLSIVFTFQAIRVDYLFLTNPQAANLPRSERSGYLEEWTSGYGIREVGVKIREIYKMQGRQIVVGTEGYFGTLPDGLQIYLNDRPQVKVIGVGVIIKDLPEELRASKKAGNPTYFVINSTRYIGDPEASGLKLLAAYPKAVRPDGSREALLFYEVTD